MNIKHTYTNVRNIDKENPPLGALPFYNIKGGDIPDTKTLEDILYSSNKQIYSISISEDDLDKLQEDNYKVFSKYSAQEYTGKDAENLLKDLIKWSKDAIEEKAVSFFNNQKSK